MLIASQSSHWTTAQDTLWYYIFSKTAYTCVVSALGNTWVFAPQIAVIVLIARAGCGHNLVAENVIRLLLLLTVFLILLFRFTRFALCVWLEDTIYFLCAWAGEWLVYLLLVAFVLLLICAFAFAAASGHSFLIRQILSDDIPCCTVPRVVIPRAWG